ncbi:MAG: hypothetical protein H5T39_00060 [Methanobacteriales archaeon]|nr:hypothetical protein [Methanobacteriaceae archaeon]MBC7096077.1 hypothetical protein [Methanobacteriales archaeon]
MEVKSIIEKKTLLKIAVIILVVAVAVAGYITYKNYRMAQMDKYVIQANQLVDEFNRTREEANTYAEEGDIDKAIIKVDKAIKELKEMISLAEKAYQYADGPYKEVIGLLIERDQLILQGLESWRSRLEYIKEGDYASAWELKDQEKDIITEIEKIEARKEAIKSKHPDVKQHIESKW